MKHSLRAALAAVAFITLGAGGCNDRDGVRIVPAGSGGGVASGGAPPGAGASGGFTFDAALGGAAAGGADAASPAGPVGDGGAVCAIQPVETERLPPELLLLLDRSSSMDLRDVAEAAGKTRWEALVPAVVEVVGMTQSTVSWGLKLYPTPALPPEMACTVSPDPEVAFAAGSGGGVTAQINASRPSVPNSLGGTTPTHDVVNKAVAYMKTRPTPNPKVILLATDGEPTCVADAAAASEAAVAASKAAGYDVFVIGIKTGGVAAQVTLDALAVAGGRARPAGGAGSPRYYAADSRAELSAALTAITASIGSCVFTLTQTPPDPLNVGIELGGVLAPRSEWRYGEGMRTIEVTGETCNKVKSGGVAARILFGCPDNPIP